MNSFTDSLFKFDVTGVLCCRALKHLGICHGPILLKWANFLSLANAEDSEFRCWMTGGDAGERMKSIVPFFMPVLET
jgi:hypothetical protein